MRVLLFLTAVVVFASAWTAYKPNDDFKFSGMSVEEWAATYLMPIDPNEIAHVPVYNGNGDESPVDWRGHKCVHEVRDQGGCGSCWAFATSEMASDRACIDSNGETDAVFSPQYLVDCDDQEFGCGGAATQRVVGWIAKNGILEDSCYSYNAVQGKCHKTTCDDGSEAKLYEFTDDKIWEGAAANVEDLMKALEDGPVYFSMQCASDFMTYSGGIFETKTGSYVGGHAVKAVGWGIDETRADQDVLDSHYWIVANSWGARWGEEGFFRIYFNQKIAYNAGYLTY